MASAERLVQGLVDEGEGLAHADRLAFDIQHPGVAGVNVHAGADGGRCRR
jgi:hypothetical protein